MDGGVLVTCAPTATVTLFPDDSSTPAWTLTSACSSSVDTMTRAVPVQIE